VGSQMRMLVVGMLFLAPALLLADETLGEVASRVNPRLVKVYGSGGVKGLPGYGTGILVSADGYILTTANHLPDSSDLRVHLHDGTRLTAKVVASEPELDAALLKINDKHSPDGLPFFDIAQAAKTPTLIPGTGVLAFSNQFQIATRDEPMTVQRGVVAAVAQLYGRIGVFEAPYTGSVYVIDAITNNPGAAGGALTTRRGELVGLIGRELRNDQTQTWINYAIPVNATIAARGVAGRTLSLMELIEKKEAYRPSGRPDRAERSGQWNVRTGWTLVPAILDRTPPYIEEVEPASPAGRAGAKPDDLIVYIDGAPVPTISALYDILDKYRPGDKVQVEVRRLDRLHTLTVELEPVPKTPR
jgi:S1-C subfamily serine protease